MPSAPDWEELKFPVPLSKEDSWFLVDVSAEAAGFPMDSRLSSEEEGDFQSMWVKSTMPFGKGTRCKLFVKYLDIRDGKVTGLRFYVAKEVNTSMERPFFPEESDWERAGQDKKKQAIFRQHLVSRLLNVEK